MSSIRTKLIVAGIVLVAAIGYLASAGIKSGFVYYLEVDKFLSDVQYRSQRVRLHGKVDTEAFLASSGSLTANFNLMGKSKKLPVVYHGSIPDMFQAGRDVVVEGKINDAGTFQADVLMTKCASKYEPGSPHTGTEKAK